MAAGNRLCHAGVPWLWSLVVGWKMGFDLSNKMQQVTWIYAMGITGIRKQLGFERQT